MENLSILEKEALDMLRQLERCCQVAEENPKHIEEHKCVYVMFNELKLQKLGDTMKTQDVVSYLQRNGVDFEITFDLENDFVDMYLDREHPDERFIELGRIKGENLEEIQGSIQKLKDELVQKSRIIENNILKDKKSESNEDVFEVFLNDREIKINNYLISKPHAVGTNMCFFEYIFKNPDKDINLDKDIPDNIKNDFEWKKTSKLLNSIGFVGETLKVFFTKRSDKVGSRIVNFRKKISKKEIIDSGINFDLFVKELEVKNIKNNPK